MAIADDLRFVSGAVASKDYAEELCHLLIKDGRVVAYDGTLSASSTIDMELHAKPHAKTLAQAVKMVNEGETIALSMTPKGRLSFRSGKFKVFVDCLPNEAEMTLPMPEGEEVTITDELFSSITDLAPYMGIDASRPWAMGLMLRGNSTWATNNIVFVERWHGSAFPHDIILPAVAVNELLRIGKKPTKVQVTHNSASFWFGEDRWLRTALVEGEWPNIERVFSAEHSCSPFPADFFAALDTLKPFLSKDRPHVLLLENKVATTDEEGTGASVDLDMPDATGQRFNHAVLRSLEPIASRIDFSLHPAPCVFYGDKLRGVIIGMRQ
jgi:DNA polymerase III sliding clamp (beta) subunit (PCNA family)